MTTNQQIHVGKLIQDKFEELHPDKTQVWLGEQLDLTDRTVRKDFKREVMRINKIKAYSVAIGYNFLADLNHNDFEDVDNLTLTEIEAYLGAQILKAYDNYKREHPECTKRWLADKLCVGERTLWRWFHSAPVDDVLLRKLSNILGTNLFTPIFGILYRHLEEVKAGRTGLLTFVVENSNSDKFTLFSEDYSRSQTFDLMDFLFNAGMMDRELREGN